MSIYVEREAVLARVSSAFTRRDHEAALSEMCLDVEVLVPGNTPFAGSYRGRHEVHGWLVAMRRAFTPAEQRIEFSHDGNDTMMREAAWVRNTGYWHNRFRFTFRGPLIRRIALEPDDMRAFDALITRVIDAPPETVSVTRRVPAVS